MKKFLLTVLVLLMMTSVASYGQAISQNGGSIQGTITDPTGAAVSGATVVISDPATGYTHTLKTDKAGFYALGPLTPGGYVVSVTAPSFEKLEIKTIVQVGTVTSGNEKLTVGSAAETVEVNAGEVLVNTEQVGVAGVVTKEQIDTLPINGRNILDIAQIQPGVQLQSGQVFDPTKTGYSALAVNGQNGRSTRILVDGQDISDETVGTVIFNVPEGAIGEFQLNRSTQDVSGSVTSTGQVLLATQSGTNRYHGNLFYNFQDARAGFAHVNGEYGPFQRNQFGGYVGGYIIKDKLFFFGGSERLKQANSSPVERSSPFFTSIYDQFPQTPDPFKDTFSVGRLDYNAPWGVHLFARATYSNNIGFGTAGQPPYALFSNQDNVPAIVGGGDFTTGKFTHSIRFGYLKFINHIAPGANDLGSQVYNPSTALGVPFEFIGAIYAGSGNEDAPQDTYQTSKSFRYDGTWTKGKHSIKYGGEVTRILQGGFASFFNTFLADISTNPVHLLAQCASANPQGGFDAGATTCSGDPVNGYSAAEFVLGNGQGSASERPAFGLPGGGSFSWRMAAYVGDTWKATPSLTLVAGLRWSVDTDRANQDLATPTCGQVDPSLQFAGCDGTTPNAPLFDQYAPGLGLGKRTPQNYANFGPQVGFVFSPGSHKLALRGGAGIYYENNLFNNGGNARAQNTTAEFPALADGSNIYTSKTLQLPGYNNNITGLSPTGVPCDGSNPTPSCLSWSQIYSLPLAQSIPIIGGLDQLYKAAAAVPQQNGSFIGGGNGLFANSAYGGKYKTPYSIQLNGGMQYEVKRGLVVSVDFLHQATLKVPLSVDVNHNGAARTLNTTAAKNAVANLLADCGVATVDAAIAACPGLETDPNTGQVFGAALTDFAGEGLDSGNARFGGQAASASLLTPNTGAAFAGDNANVGTGSFILPVGKSAYDALQIVVQQQKTHPFRGIVSSNMQISYNLSRAVSNSGAGSGGQGSNQFFAGATPWNNDCVNCYIGRNDLDQTNQLSLSGSFTIKYGLQIGLVGHFFSAPPSNLALFDVTGATSKADPGAIYQTDLDGDGTAGDLLPGQLPGSYMHSVKGKNLGAIINNFNATQAGRFTPAGQALINNGILTAAQLTALGGVVPQLAPVPQGNAIQNAATRTLDASIKYPIGYLKKYREGLVLTPGVTMYNVTNMSNFGAFGGLADASITGVDLQNFLNGPNTQDVLNHGRINRGSGNGTFDQGGPRTTEFSLKLTF